MDKLIEIDVNKLTPYQNNAKIHSKDQVEMIANSIRDFGFSNPVIVDENHMILAGHGRVMAAQKLGMKKVPCRVIEGLTEDQKKAYILADNKLFELGGWDRELLNTEMETLDLDLSDYGFDTFETIGDDEEFETEPKQISDGSEIDLDSFADDEFDYECPYCHFMFNEKGDEDE